ncbi:MAG: metallophosphoesterase [Anaerolineae bacterium]|nr:metallophosphoesterase [Anaerolineae bacterium]
MTQPLEESTLHRVLVMTNQLQLLPATAVAGSFAVNSLLVAVIWLQHGAAASALGAAFGVLVASLINWTLLRRLPAQGRSFGPDQPAALALGAGLALVALLLGLFGASLAVMLLALALITALAYYATWIEPFRLTLTRQRLTAPAWQGDPLRLLHISDLHVERTTERERRLNALIESLQPDVIVFSGDFVSLSYTHDAQAKADIRSILSEWRAPLGVFCVPGTPVVEPITRVLEFVEGLDNLTLLANRWVTVDAPGGDAPSGALHILGLVTTHDLKTDRAALAGMMRTAPDGGVKLLLVHAPDIAPEAADAGIDLYLCGHTHGGQIRLPLVGALASSSQLGKRFIMGRYPVKHMTLYTSRGIGMEGLGAPRARLLCPPELILWEIGASPGAG